MDVFKTQVQGIRELFYKMCLREQICAFEMLQQMFYELQAVLVQLNQHSNQNEIPVSSDVLHTKEGKENQLWKSNDNPSSLEADQSCFDVTLLDDTCCHLLNQNSVVESALLDTAAEETNSTTGLKTQFFPVDQESLEKTDHSQFDPLQPDVFQLADKVIRLNDKDDILESVQESASEEKTMTESYQRKTLAAAQKVTDVLDSSDWLVKNVQESDKTNVNLVETKPLNREANHAPIADILTDALNCETNTPIANDNEPSKFAASLKEKRSCHVMVTRSSQRIAIKTVSSTRNKELYKTKKLNGGKCNRAEPLKTNKFNGSDQKKKLVSTENEQGDGKAMEKVTTETVSISRIKQSSVTCRNCQKAFSGMIEFSLHRCRRKPTMLNCDRCQLKFVHPQHFEKHMNGHNRNSCKICNAQFAKRKALCKHMRLVHKIKEAEKLYECSYCGRKFIKRPSLYIHLKEHAGEKIVCMKCGCMCDSKEQFTQHMRKHSEEAKHHCVKCNENFQRRQQYEQHMMGHEKYDCGVCDISFSTKKHLIRHRRLIHSIQIQEEKKHECSICHKRFQRPMLLEIHHRLHTGEKPIQCNYCEKNFRTPKALAKHMKTVSHLKAAGQTDVQSTEVEKSFLCAECGAKFFRKQGLIRHTQQLHSEERPFVCPHCDYTCKCKTNLKRHIELHTDERRFICELCGASFHARATLKEHHAYVHSEARNFVCPECGKGFKGRSGLRRHSRIHSDARPYICYCGQSYKRMSHLKRHMVSMHGVAFKSKRVIRLQDENSQSSSTTKPEGDGDSNDALAPDSNEMDTVQDKDLESDNETVASKTMAEMFRDLPLELGVSHNPDAGDTTSIQHLLSLACTQDVATASTSISSTCLDQPTGLAFSLVPLSLPNLHPVDAEMSIDGMHDFSNKIIHSSATFSTNTVENPLILQTTSIFPFAHDTSVALTPPDTNHMMSPKRDNNNKDSTLNLTMLEEEVEQECSNQLSLSPPLSSNSTTSSLP